MDFDSHVPGAGQPSLGVHFKCLHHEDVVHGHTKSLCVGICILAFHSCVQYFALAHTQTQLILKVVNT